MASQSLSEGEFPTFTSTRTGTPDLRLLHYNDVYHVEPGSREPVGGIARFQTLCNHYASALQFASQPSLLTLFSGDAFNPSLESSVTKGSHMVPILNGTRIDAACLGNHDLDFGMEQFAHLAAKCDFPWLVANVLDPALGEDVPLGNCRRTVMLTASNGVKVGVIGLVEREWLETINSLPPNLEYLSASATAADLVPKLREQGAEIVLAVTHQRQPNDEKLARKLPASFVDLILGGHDHTYDHCVINGMHLLRSGTDFKQLSYIEAFRKSEGKGWDFNITRRDVVASIQEDPETLEIVDNMTSALRAKLEKPIGYTSVPLDARFTTVRLAESNYANFVCDLMRLHYSADCTIMAAGTVRGDQVYPPGVLKVKDIMNCFPFEDPCVVVDVTGEAIVAALENGVSKWPALEGRFPQVSGIRFAFDPREPEGRRVRDVEISGAPVDETKLYRLATRDYMVRGKDGFTSLLLEDGGGTAKSVVSEENGLLISMIMRQYFMSLKIIGRWKKWGSEMGRHWGGVQAEMGEAGAVSGNVDGSAERKGREDIATAEIPSLVGRAQSPSSEPDDAAGKDEIDSNSDDEDSVRADLPAVHAKLSEDERKLLVMRKFLRKWWRLAGLEGHPGCCGKEEWNHQGGVSWTRGIAPKLEGRISCLAERLSQA